ncbi:MAG: EF-hand domain-containing protein [Magnetococcales bacterium]|nr:EF-hand domain-containing protein [Magnetococcales bacterium]
MRTRMTVLLAVAVLGMPALAAAQPWCQCGGNGWRPVPARSGDAGQTMRSWRESHFHQMDVNRDGQVDKEELTSWRGAPGWVPPVYTLADQDKDGRLSLTEFVTFTPPGWGYALNRGWRGNCPRGMGRFR